MVAKEEDDLRLADTYIEVSDRTLRKYVEGMLPVNITKSSSLSQIIRLHHGEWLLKLSPDISKMMGKG